MFLSFLRSSFFGCWLFLAITWQLRSAIDFVHIASMLSFFVLKSSLTFFETSSPITCLLLLDERLAFSLCPADSQVQSVDVHLLPHPHPHHLYDHLLPLPHQVHLSVFCLSFSSVHPSFSHYSSFCLPSFFLPKPMTQIREKLQVNLKQTNENSWPICKHMESEKIGLELIQRLQLG